MSEKIASARFAYAIAVPKWDVLAVAKLIADATLTEAKAQGQIRRFAQRQWVPTVDRRGTGKNAANLFGPAAVAGAKILSVLTELGTNQQIIEKVWPVLYHHGDWRSPQPEGEHPVLRAIVDAATGRPWVLQIEARRGDQPGALLVRAFVHEPALGAFPPWVAKPSVPPHATITLDLAALLLPLHHRFMASINEAETADSIDLARAGQP